MRILSIKTSDSASQGEILLNINLVERKIQLDISLSEGADVTTLVTNLTGQDAETIANAIQQFSPESQQILNFHDADSKDDLLVIIKEVAKNFTLVLSLKKNGDIQVSLKNQDVLALTHGIQKSIEILKASE